MSDVPSFDPSTTGISAEERQWAMFAHLSALLVGFVGPLIIWLIKKDTMRFVDDQGKEALNFQINITVLAIAIVPVTAIVTAVTFGFGILAMLPIGLGISVLAIIFPILAAVKVNAGEAYRYPYIIRLVK